jgi:hypothetical protein
MLRLSTRGTSLPAAEVLSFLEIYFQKRSSYSVPILSHYYPRVANYHFVVAGDIS